MLGRWDVTVADAPRQDVAERMGHWLPVRDAITLDAAHRAIQALPMQWSPPRGRTLARDDAVAQEVRRVRATLVQAIAAPPALPPATGHGRHALPTAQGPVAPAAEPDTATAFAPWRKRYLDLQRQMELRIDALRAHVRQQLATRSPELAQLAALDAVMEKTLAERTHKALSALPALMERRCLQPVAGGAIDPQAWGREMQDLLMAELDTRLEPVVGMMEAGARHGGAGRSTDA